MRGGIKFVLVIFIGLIGLIGAYSGVWYYGCTRLEARLAKSEFESTFGPEKALSTSTKIDRGPFRYTGLLQGEIGVEADVKSVSSHSSVKLPNQGGSQDSSSQFTSGDRPFVYRVSLPVWGRTATLSVSPFHEALYKAEISGQKVEMLQSGDGGAVTLSFSDARLAHQREAQIDAIVAEPKRAFTEISDIEFARFKGRTLTVDDKSEIFTTAINGGGLHWEVGPDDMMNVRYDLDAELAYAAGAAKWMEGPFSAIPRMAGSPSAETYRAFMDLFREIFFSGAFMTKGGIQAVFPAHKLGIGGAGQSAGPGMPFYPLEVRFDNFKARLPIPLTGSLSLDGGVSFMRGDAKPLAINFVTEAGAIDVGALADKIIKLAATAPEAQRANLDLSRLTPSSLVSLQELVSDQGALVLFYSGFRALARSYFNQSSRTSVQVDLKTASGNPYPIEMMGAKATWNLSWMLGNGVGAGCEGSADGLKNWKATVALRKLPEVLREFREPLMFASARAFLERESKAGRLNLGVASGQQQEVVTFLLSDGLFNKLISAVERVVQRIDQTPDTKDELQIVLEGAGSAVKINGKRLDEFQASLLPIVMQEAQTLMSELEPQLATFRTVSLVEPE